MTVYSLNLKFIESLFWDPSMVKAGKKGKVWQNEEKNSQKKNQKHRVERKQGVLASLKKEKKKSLVKVFR